MDERGFVREEVIDANGQRRQQRRASPEPSSPAASTQSHNLFSDAEQLTSESPPSSPLHRASSPAHKPHKPTFKSLKRKRIETNDEPLGEVSDNANARRAPNAKAGAKRTRYTQMQLDLGKSARRTCRGCGMEYVPSSREDERLHKDFHSLNDGGVDLGTGFAKDSQTVERFGFGEVVAMLVARSPVSLQRRVKRVLEVVRSDLGAVEISDDRIWGRDASKSQKRDGDGTNEDRYRLFVYLAGDKCVGLCLAERIRHASKVVDSRPQPAVTVDSPTPTEDKPKSDTERKEESENILPDFTPSALHTETSIAPMLVGISRVWVSRSHRRKGIATTLLEAARQNFFYGIEVPREMVAFSQPTESGRQLAEDWFEQRVGWHVYAEG
jgi:N-acetyltransferase